MSESDRTGLRTQQEAYELGRSDERIALRPVIEALLLVEHMGPESLCPECLGTQGAHAKAHGGVCGLPEAPGCSLDAALTLAGYPSEESRNEARVQIRRAAVTIPAPARAATWCTQCGCSSDQATIGGECPVGPGPIPGKRLHDWRPM